MHLPTTPPFDGAAVLDFLAARAIPGVEEVVDGTYRRTLALPHGTAVLALTPCQDRGVDAELTLADPRDEPVAVTRARALFGLDADPRAVAAHLGADPVLGPLVAARPGLRVPGAVDGWELAVRAVLGQQVSVAAARVLAGRIAERLGAPVADPAGGGLARLFPVAGAVAAAPDDAFPMPRTRIRTLRGVAESGLALDAPADAAALADLWGIGPWTAGYVQLRLGDPDVFLDGDVALARALAARGATVADAPRWAPLRSFAVVHLWRSLANPVAGVRPSAGVRSQTR